MVTLMVSDTRLTSHLDAIIERLHAFEERDPKLASGRLYARGELIPQHSGIAWIGATRKLER